MSAVHMRFEHGGDLCLGFWARHYDRGECVFPAGARVLEIGCAEADWLTPMRTARPDLDLVGLDVRPCTQLGAVQGDVLTCVFPSASFDAIVSVSAIEHIGLGAYGDPLDADGDTKAMQRAADWLKPGGWMYLDVPYSESLPYANLGKHRRYSPDSITRLIVPGFALGFACAHNPAHPDAPYLALRLDRL